jgi:hypothetical protein
MRKPTLVRLIVGAMLLATGVGLAFLWSAFAALYVPECSTFSIHSADPRCRIPVLWVYAGYSLAAIGGLTLAYEVFRRLRRS